MKEDICKNKQDSNNKKNLHSIDNHHFNDQYLIEMELLTYNPENSKLLDEFLSDPEFDNELDLILAKLKNDLDLKYIQAELILFLKNKIKNSKSKERTSIKELTKEREKKIIKQIKDLSLYLMQKKSPKIKSIFENIYLPKDQYHHISIESKKNLKKIIKKFSIYQLYKLINPKQIAGETKKDNFEENIISRGFKYAAKNEGGELEANKKFGKSFVTELKNKHSNSKGKGGISF